MRYNLSEITDLIKDRRTIYPETYSDRLVQTDQIKMILNNAIWAPSHKLTQPWRFKVFMKEGKKRLGEFMKELYLKNTPVEQQNAIKLNRCTDRPARASAVIMVCMKRDPKESVPEIEEIQAVACAVQNMYLTCAASGLGGFYSTPKMLQNKEVNEFLGLEEKDKCLGLFYVGYPSGEWPKGRRKPIEYVSEWFQE